MYFCFKSSIGTQGEVHVLMSPSMFQQQLKSPILKATDSRNRSPRRNKSRQKLQFTEGKSSNSSESVTTYASTDIEAEIEKRQTYCINLFHRASSQSIT